MPDSHMPFAEFFAQLQNTSDKKQTNQLYIKPDQADSPPLAQQKKKNKSKEDNLLPPCSREETALFLDAVNNIRQPRSPVQKNFIPPALEALQPPSPPPMKKKHNNRQLSSGSPTPTEQAGSQKGAVPYEADFAKAMRGVTPLVAKGREVAPAPLGQQGPAAAPDALQQFLDGSFEFALSHSDEYFEGFIAGIDLLVMNKLRAGSYSPEAHLDLHGKNSEQALDALFWFIKNAYYKNMRTVLIITGKGKNSPDKMGVLRTQLQSWLTKDPFKRVVLAFCSAQPSDGGTGAVYILLRKFKRDSGKIVWERMPSTEDFS